LDKITVVGKNSWKKVVIALVIVSMSGGSLSACKAVRESGAGSLPEPGASVLFVDESLDAAVREEINKPIGAIVTADLEKLITLTASERNIKSLSGLEHCKNLNYLELSHNMINDISPLASLTNLTLLNLTSNQIADISPLASLTRLTEINLSDNNIYNISSLASLSKISWLAFEGNWVKDISPLLALPVLQALLVFNNPLDDFSIISRFTSQGIKVSYLHSGCNRS